MAVKILITGIGAQATEQGIRTLLCRFGAVERIDIIREGSASDPVAFVEMNLGDGVAAHLVSRLTRYWHEGALISAYQLIY